MNHYLKPNISRPVLGSTGPSWALLVQLLFNSIGPVFSREALLTPPCQGDLLQPLGGKRSDLSVWRSGVFLQVIVFHHVNLRQRRAQEGQNQCLKFPLGPTLPPPCQGDLLQPTWWQAVRPQSLDVRHFSRMYRVPPSKSDAKTGPKGPKPMPRVSLRAHVASAVPGGFASGHLVASGQTSVSGCQAFFSHLSVPTT